MNLLNFEAGATFEGEPLIIDSFAGGGGASTGIEMALGRSPDIAINHNPAALALHEANHPQTLHLSENVYKVDPLDHVAGKHIGLAWFSPDCKHFSKAKGGKPVERNIRDLAWIIPGWVERIQNSGGCVDVVILENVEEFQDWGPLLDTERGLMPDPEARGQTFQKWCKVLRRLGGKIEHRELRACDYGAPTIRKRLFVIVRFDGQKIVWPKPTHGKPDDPDVLAGRKLPWRTAAEIIDWSLPCPSIFDSGAEIMEKLGLRAVRPLADATMSRVARGVDRYVLKAKKPFLVSVAHGYSGGRREYPIDDPFGVVTAGGISHAVVSPSISRFNTGATGHDMREPLATITANSFKKRPGGAAPLGIVAPVLSYAQQGGANRSVEDPAHTITASTKDQNTLIAPTLIQTGYGEREGQAPRALDIGAPIGTVAAGGAKHALAVPTLVGCGGRAGQSRARGGDEPMATQTAKADVCVAAAFLAQNNYQEPGHDAREPVSTIVQKGSTQSVVAAFVSRQFGTSIGHEMEEPTHTATAKVNKSMLVAPHLMTMRNAGKPFNGADEPTHTITAGGAGISVVAPFMQKYYGTGDGARVDDPCHSVTTKDRFGFVEAECGWPPFTEAQAARARHVADFMRAHGFWDEREFVTVEIAGEVFTIVDIGMRMLTPRELFSAQGFPHDYIIEFEFNGKPLPKSDQIACCGNSVSPPMAAALVAANCGHLMRYREAAE
ncbi:DNA cytosine methyltransferase [Mesorhizobium sp. B2-6-3]|uniref:DNA cytosine methyltransferase n=1 Tax=Mesorhizobium sp. B2-6-3 TaxID=2589914 RepID=UPI001FEEBC0E|nr:DNA cytosine methyltransferase [Mesorhizobium sp. B2-6-3]